MENFGSKIKDLRASKKVSADKLADYIGKKGPNKKQYIYDIENDRIKRLDIGTLTKIAEFFNVEISYFLAPSEKNNLLVTPANGETTEQSEYKEKYLKALEENSILKTKLIKLMEKYAELTC